MTLEQTTRDRDDREKALLIAAEQANVAVKNGLLRPTSTQVVEVAERYRKFLAGEPESTEEAASDNS